MIPKKDQLDLISFGMQRSAQISELQSTSLEYVVKGKRPFARCLKITEKKVSFNIVRAGNYGYILSGQKFIKNAKNYNFGEFLKNVKLAVKHCYQTDQF